MKGATEEKPMQRAGGQMAEDLVCRALQDQGWTIAARNFRTVGSELDIVAWQGRSLVVVEVKQRQRPPAYASDLAALLPFRKRAALLRGAQAFLSKHPIDCETVRFDLALVTGTQAKLHYFSNIAMPC